MASMRSRLVKRFMALLLFVSVSAAQSMTFAPAVNLNENAVAFSQSAIIGTERVLFGGIHTITNVSAITVYDPASYFQLNSSSASVGINSNPVAITNLIWGPYNFTLPMPMSGSFSVQYDNFLFVTPMGTQMAWGTGCDDCIWYTVLNEALPDGMVSWIPIPFNKSLVPRRRAGLAASHNRLRLFGGVPQNVSDGTLQEIVTYNMDTKTWEIEATFNSSISEYLSSCAVFYITDEYFTLACVSSSMWQIMMGSWFPNFEKNELQNASVFPLDRPLVGGMCITQVGQFLVGFGQRIGKSGTFNGGCSPYILTIDLSTKEATPLTAVDVSCRFGATLFSNGPQLFLAGGINPDTMQLTGAVEFADFGPHISAATKDGGRQYKKDDTITILTQPCGPGTVLRLANSPTCQTNFGHTQDVACVPSAAMDYSTGSTVFHADEAGTAYLCVAFGSCAIERPDRSPCPFAMATTDFYTCTRAGCCYDSSDFYDGLDRCYAYKANTDAEADGENYFMLVPPSVPFVISSNPQSTPPFWGTRNGIIILSCVGSIVLVFVAIGLVWLRRMRFAAIAAAQEEGTKEQDTEGEYYGKYKIIRKLGQGGFGSVFLVRRATDGKELALKHIVCKDEEERTYAVTEFEILYAAQGHENMISLEEMIITWEKEGLPNTAEDAGKLQAESTSLNSSGTPVRSYSEKTSGSTKKGEMSPLLSVAPKAVCIVMDYCPDGDLSAYVKKVHQLTGRSLPEHLLLRVVADQLCSLLIHLQSRTPAICHRDLKPENILLKDNATRIMVTDFGLAQSLDKSFMSTRAGTLHYMAPECWKRHYTTTVDMWALGCILYACATGRVDPENRRVMFHDAKKPNFKREILFDLREYSELFQTIVLGLLIVDPANRLTAEKVLELLSEN